MPFDINRILVYPRRMRHAIENNPAEDRLRELLFGRRIVRAEETSEHVGYYYAEGRLTLDDGTVLLVGGNEGCGGCPSGHYSLTALAAVDNAITNVVCETTWHDRYEEDGTYRIFVVSEDQHQHLVAQFDGSDGNGYYGSGWWLTVLPQEVS